LLPERLLLHDVAGDAILPRYLTARDEPWLASLLRIARLHVGRLRRELDGRLRDELPAQAPRDAMRLASRVLLDACAREPATGPRPSVVRRMAYAERADSRASREAVVASVARRLAVEPEAIERSLYADLPAERLLGALPDDMSAADLARRINLRLVQGLVARSGGIRVELEGHARRVVQAATWQGLICTVRGDEEARCVIDVSGPMAVLHATRLYARGLASVVPVLPWCRRFLLQARCLVEGRELALRIDESAPIERGAEPRRHDSLLEKSFEDDMRRLAPDWDVLREPRALPVDGTLVFPDFAIGPRAEPDRRVLVEIAGWWTPEYIEAKLARLRAARCERLIVCVAERSGVAPAAAGLAVMSFRRRVDVPEVIRRAREMLGVGTGR